MRIELSEPVKATYQAAANNLTGSVRRKFMAGIVASLGRGGLSYCAKELGWDPKTMRKGRHELASGIDLADRPSNPGRKRTEERLPTLCEDLRRIVDEQSQTDATFQSERLYTRLSVQAVRTQLLAQHGYTAEQLPSNEVLRQRLNELGYKLRTVKKNQPKKRSLRPMTSSSS
jgi:Rhodopirellula transposase DDE domain